MRMSGKSGRSERIRTSDPVVPNDVRYQAALHSVTSGLAYRPVTGAPQAPFPSIAASGGNVFRTLPLAFGSDTPTARPPTGKVRCYWLAGGSD